MAWYDNWLRAQRLVITVPSGTVSTLSYFPIVLTEASLPTELTNNIFGNSTGADLAFATDLGVGNSVSSIGDRIPCEVVTASFGGTPSAEIHVQVPSIAATGTLTYIWVLYGNSSQTSQPAANATYGSQAVWNENGTQNFVGVWHLQGTGTPSTYPDSTSNGITGTNFGATAAAGEFGSSTGGAASFNGTSAYITCGNQTLANFTTGNFSVSCWVKATGTNQVIVGQGKYQDSGWYTEFLNNASVKFAANITGLERAMTTAANSVSKSAWHLLNFNRTGSSTVAIYSDGVLLTPTGLFTDPQTCSVPLAFGVYYDLATTFFAGSIDEIRISSVSRDISWVASHYSNQSAPGTFIAPPSGQGPISIAAITITASGAIKFSAISSVSPATFKSTGIGSVKLGTVSVSSAASGTNLITLSGASAGPWNVPVQFTVTLALPAPTGGIAVSMQSTGTYDTFQATSGGANVTGITIAAGQTTGTFWLTPSGSAPISGLLAQWLFSEGTGTSAADASGNGHTGTLVGSVSWGTGLTGVGTYAVNFTTPGSDYISVPDSSSLSFTSAQSFSLSAWVYVPSLPSTINNVTPPWLAIVSKGVGGGNYYGIWINPQDKWSAGAAGTNVITGTQLNTGWHHVALVQDASANTLVLYADGIVSGSTTARNCNGTGNFLIGGDTHSADNFNGAIDDVRVYDHALTLSDIQSIISVVTPGTLPFLAAPNFPFSNSTGVDVASLVTAVFNQPIQENTIGFSLQDPAGDNVPVSLTYNSGTKTATLDPVSSLANGTVYTATLTNTRSQNGDDIPYPFSWSFTTLNNPSSTAPTVTVTPANTATSINNTSLISAVFSQNIKESTLSFTVSNSGGSIAGAVSYNPVTYTAVFLPLAPLPNSTVHTVVISGAQNQANVAMTTSTTTFTTGSSATSLATVYLTPGWATFGQVFPQGVATNTGLRVGSLTTQADVKNAWGDGSIKYAVVTANVVTAGLYSITSIAASGSAYTPTLPTASVALVISGTTYTAVLPSTLSSDLWLSGPNVVNGRYVVTPMNGATPHGFLQVIYDVVSYNDGATQLQVTVANHLDKTGAIAVVYDVVVTVSSQTIFSQLSVSHAYGSNWHKCFNLNFSPSVSVLDFRPWVLARAIPNYSINVTNTIYSPAGADFNIMQVGDLNPAMGSPGGRDEIAPYPNWTARYLVYQNPIQRSYVIWNGYLSGTWPCHLQEPVGGTYTGVGALKLVSIIERPTYSGAAAGTYGPQYTNTGSPISLDSSHEPSLAYIPYLVTGDRYFADEMAQWADWAELTVGGGGTDQLGNANPRQNGGLIVANQPRGIAWGLRNITDAATYLPDTDGVKSYLSPFVTNNLNYFDDYAAGYTNPVGVYFDYTRSSDNLYMMVAPWQNNYIAWAIQHAHDLGYSGGSTLLNSLATFQLSLFQSGGTIPNPNWLIGYAMQTWFVTATISGGTITHYASLHDMFIASFGSFTTPTGTPNTGVGGYAEDARLAAMIGISGSLQGAQAVYDYLMATTGMQGYLNTNAGFYMNFVSGVI